MQIILFRDIWWQPKDVIKAHENKNSVTGAAKKDKRGKHKKIVMQESQKECY